MKFEAKTYLGYVGKEVIQPTVYFFATIIGSAICFLTSTLTIIPEQPTNEADTDCQEAGLASDNLSGWDSETDFARAYPFDPQVLAFLGRPVRNFIAYSRADVRITAFNFRSDISVHEREFFEVVGKVFGTMLLVADLRIPNRRE